MDAVVGMHLLYLAIALPVVPKILVFPLLLVSMEITRHLLVSYLNL